MPTLHAVLTLASLCAAAQAYAPCECRLYIAGVSVPLYSLTPYNLTGSCDAPGIDAAVAKCDQNCTAQAQNWDRWNSLFHRHNVNYTIGQQMCRVARRAVNIPGEQVLTRSTTCQTVTRSPWATEEFLCCDGRRLHYDCYRYTQAGSNRPLQEEAYASVNSCLLFNNCD